MFEVHRAINRTQEAFSFSFGEDVENFTGFSKGALLAHDGETQYFAEVEGEAVIFPNANVALGQRAVLTERDWLARRGLEVEVDDTHGQEN